MRIKSTRQSRLSIYFLVIFVLSSIPISELIASELQFRDKGIDELERAVREQEQRMKAQEGLLREYQLMLDRQRHELNVLRTKVDAQSLNDAKGDRTPRIHPAALPAVPSPGPAARTDQRSKSSGTSPVADKPKTAQSETSIEEQQPKQRPDVPLIAEKGGVLLHQGQVVIEPSVDFSLVETNRVEVAGFTVLPAILVGNFNVSKVERETLTAALTGRVGITNRFELEGRVPYVYRNDRETRRPIGTGSDSDETVKLDGYGIGDIEMAAHYQINDGGGRLPFFVGNLRAKSDTGTSPFDVDTDSSGNPTELPTGSGFWSLQPSVTAIMPTDPAVVFANMSYTWNIERSVDGFGDIDPGDTFGASLGIGFALNERLSLSMAYDHTYVMETTQNGEENNSAFHIGRMLFGGSYKFADKASANLNFAVGVTEQAPDIQTELRIPVTFQAFGK